MKISGDSKSCIKLKLKTHLSDRIVQSDNEYMPLKKKSGRPQAISNDICLDAIFYVLLEGVTWEFASKLATNSTNFFQKKSLDKRQRIYIIPFNRTYQKWIDRSIFDNTCNDPVQLYKSTTIDESVYYIDSTDIQNKWMSRKKTYKSFKLLPIKNKIGL